MELPVVWNPAHPSLPDQLGIKGWIPGIKYCLRFFLFISYKVAQFLCRYICPHAYHMLPACVDTLDKPAACGTVKQVWQMVPVHSAYHMLPACFVTLDKPAACGTVKQVWQMVLVHSGHGRMRMKNASLQVVPPIQLLPDYSQCSV